MLPQTHRLCAIQRFLRRFHAGFPVHAHAADGLKALVGQHEDAAVVCLEVVDLLAEEKGPEILADEFDAVQSRLWPWTIGAESIVARISMSARILLPCSLCPLVSPT